MNRVSEADLERIRELTKVSLEDPLAAQQWAVRVKADLQALIEDATDRLAEQGGGFAERLRAALEAEIVTAVNGRTVLTPKPTEHSLSVYVAEGVVFVDVRLRIQPGGQ